jgi:hypothetical protein
MWRIRCTLSLRQLYMRVRIVRKPPALYGNGVDAESFAVGRIYNLAAALASALMLDGFAELYDALSPDEKRERAGLASHAAWTAADHAQQWVLPPHSRSKSPPKSSPRKRATKKKR